VRESDFRLRLAAVELADHVGAARPRGNLGRRGVLALTVCPLVNFADEFALDERVRLCEARIYAQWRCADFFCCGIEKFSSLEPLEFAPDHATELAIVAAQRLNE
jgi:hypothetical protein